MLAISKYDAKETASWLERNDWEYPILCDGEEIIKKYNLLNEAPQKPGREGLPHPATIIIDKDGKIRFVNVWVNYRERTSLATILAELDKLDLN